MRNFTFAAPGDEDAGDWTIGTGRILHDEIHHSLQNSQNWLDDQFV